MSVDDLSDEELDAWLESVIAKAKISYPCETISVPYGAHSHQILDLWGNPQASLIVICVHGGYFAEEFDRSVNEGLVRRLASAGALVANLEYRRSGSIDSPSQSVDDVRAGISYVLERYPGAGCVVLLGHSAGGYLCIAASTVPGVTSVMPLAPLTYLRETFEGGYDDGAIAKWMGNRPDYDPNSWERMELSSIQPCSVQYTIIHGIDDRVVPVEHSVRFACQGKYLTGQVRLIQLPEVGHYEFLDPDSSAVDMVLTLLGLDSVV